MTDAQHQAAGPRREDNRFTHGRGQYTDDLKHEGALRIVFVRSPYPSANIRAIDTAAARAHPGVAAVLTGADMTADGFVDCPTPFKLPQGDGSFAHETPRPFLPRERVRFVGEPVVMVLADTLAAALDAAELVSIDYEDRPTVTDIAAALEPGAPSLWDDRPGNVAFHWRGGDAADKVAAALAASQRVVSVTSRISRVAAMPLEPRSALAYFGDDGRPVLQVSHQSPHQMRDELAALFKLQHKDLRVLVGDVGGSFGMKWGVQREEVLVFWAALHLKRAARWTAMRSESFLADEHARDVLITSELGLDAQGKFSALRVRYEHNVGAYMSLRSVSHISNIGGIAGVYTTPVASAEVVGVFTNTQTTAAYRGAGRPDATFAIERVIDVAAAELGIDAAELRRRNLIAANAMPFRTPMANEYDCGEFERTLDRALDLAGYAGFAQRREEARRRGRLRGIGIAMPIEKAGAFGGDNATLRAERDATGDGSVTLHIGSMSVGQGHETGFPRLIAQGLGIPIEKIRYAQGDTDLLPQGRGNGGSSALIQGGSAVARAVDELIAKGREQASERLEASAADIEFGNGEFRIAGTDRRVSIFDLGLQQRGRVRADQADVSQRLPHLRGGSRSADRRGRADPLCQRRRRGPRAQSGAGRRPDPRRRGAGHQPGAARRDPLRRERPAHHRLVHRLRDAACFGHARDHQRQP